MSSVVDWLMWGARSARQAKDIMGEMCERVVACGVPLWRGAVFVRTLHPQITGRRFLWRLGAGVEVGELEFERLETAEYRESPVVRVYATMAPLRRRLRQASDAADFEVLQSLYAEGATDYLASPLLFIDGTVHVATWATRNPGGFTDEQIAALESIVAPLARVAEISALRRTATNLLDTYVGRHAGERILAGRVRRGDTESILAAIWLSDMRGFTTLADRVSPDALISLLNRYFDCQVPPILEHGGEVLKFMGDGLLAIFPLDNERNDMPAVCDAALAAADMARERVAALSGSSDIEGLDGLRFGLALHIGEVLYGNIGGGNRLDFTCIGPAVNLAARLEKLAGRLGRTMLVSEQFAQQCRSRLVPVGAHALPGFSEEQRVFADVS
ncbi:MAG TPA: adenylate/guanylate cyclase domain-containing protein [Casimicrobiaceae bacterium]|nr:adenylate/guanylate cyclase domain-containing protein [Casimicrobiaceae bacterium]